MDLSEMQTRVAELEQDTEQRQGSQNSITCRN